MPPGVVTVTSTMPAVPAGLSSTIWVARVADEAGHARRAEVDARWHWPRLVPVIVTVVPPAAGP